MRRRNDGENVACVVKRQNGKSADGLSCSCHTDKRPIGDDVDTEEEATFVEKFAFALLHFSAGVSASALSTDLHLPPFRTNTFPSEEAGVTQFANTADGQPTDLSSPLEPEPRSSTSPRPIPLAT